MRGQTIPRFRGVQAPLYFFLPLLVESGTGVNGANRRDKCAQPIKGVTPQGIYLAGRNWFLDTYTAPFSWRYNR
jgi:hypothetical protein